MSRLASIALLAAFALAAPCAGTASITDRELMDVFGRLGLRVDTNAVARPVVEALLKAVDPRGCILGPDECARAEPAATVASAEAWSEGLFYLKLRGFNPDGATNIAEALRSSMQGQPTGLVLDLRDAGGESLDSLDALLSMFAEPGTPLYSLRGTAGTNTPPHVAAQSQVSLQGITCALIVNDGTRDASELAAAVLRTFPGVVVVGWSTRGDAGVRARVPLSSGECLVVADRWAVPATGGEYHGSGVKPDIAVTSSSLPDSPVPAPIPGFTKTPSERAVGSARMRERIGGDAALQRACDLLVGLKAMRKTTSAWIPEPSARPPRSP